MAMHRVKSDHPDASTMIYCALIALLSAAAVFGIGLAILKPLADAHVVAGRPSAVAGYRLRAECDARAERANADRWDPAKRARNFAVDECADLRPDTIEQP
jgi:hypothetical protein